MDTTEKKSYSSILYSACIVLLLLSNGFILWRHTQLKKELQAASQPKSQIIPNLMNRTLPALDGEGVTLAKVKSRYVVLFAFTHADCSPCLTELTTLNRISQMRRDMQVYGLMSYSSPEEVRQTQKNFGISFPLLQDPTGEIIESLRLPKTPWKLVLSVANQDLAYEDSPSQSESEREAFLKRLMQLEGH
jgi:hypothetical protein